MLGVEGLLAADFQIRDGKLYCFRKESLEMIRPWGPEAGAWRFRAGTGWQAFSPDLRIERLEEAVSRYEKIPYLPPRRGRISNFHCLPTAGDEGRSPADLGSGFMAFLTQSRHSADRTAIRTR